MKDLTAPVDTTVIGQEAENVFLGWKMDGSASLQADTLDVIDHMLANGNAGLIDINVNQKMLCQGVQSGKIDMRDYSQFIMIGQPNEGQSLDEVKAIMLGEIEKLKRGEFSDKLLPSVKNNMKLEFLRSLDSNESRATSFVNTFIYGRPWKTQVERFDRIAGITKEQIMDFAKRHFTDGYAIVYKRQGEDPTQKKIEKPAITPIPSNRDLQSALVKEIKESKVKPIEPVFLDYEKDFARTTTKKKQPVYYIQNKQNDLFELHFVYDFGSEANKWLSYATDYLDLLGTGTMSAAEVKERFYELGCEYSFNPTWSTMTVSLSGLGENMTEAMKLMEQMLNNAKVDREAYNKYVDNLLKGRRDAKLNQKANFGALRNYAFYGKYNPTRNTPDSTELVTTNPQDVVNMIAALKNYKHDVVYYGPLAMKQLVATIDKNHITAKTLQDAPKNKPYKMVETPKNEILLAPYDAKNIYMMQLHNENQKWTPEDEAKISLFNEYFGGGMNGIVFQELRESRGLAYSAFADYSTTKRKEQQTNHAYTYIISQNDKMMDCIRVFNNILDTMPQSQPAFELARQAAMKRIASQRITKANIIFSYLGNKRIGINYDIRRGVYEALPKLTLEDIVKFEHDNMANKPWLYLILGDEKNLDMKSLEKIAPIKRVSTEEIFGY